MDDEDTDERPRALGGRPAGERMAVLEHEVHDIRRDMGRIEAEIVLIKTEGSAMRSDLAAMKGEIGVVMTSASDARDSSREARDAAARVEAKLNEPSAMSYLVRKVADRINAWVLGVWGIGMTLLAIAVVAVTAFAGGYITEFATNLDGKSGGFSISNQPKPMQAIEANDDADTEANARSGGGGASVEPEPSP